MMTTQAEKAEAFRLLHEAGSAFVAANFWDQGSARLLEHLGFKALASSSAGFAFSVAKSDLAVTKASLMTHLAGVCQAGGRILLGQGQRTSFAHLGLHGLQHLLQAVGLLARQVDQSRRAFRRCPS